METGSAPGPSEVGGCWRFFSTKPENPKPNEVDPHTGYSHPHITLSENDCNLLGLPVGGASITMTIEAVHGEIRTGRVTCGAAAFDKSTKAASKCTLSVGHPGPHSYERPVIKQAEDVIEEGVQHNVHTDDLRGDADR